jgi:thymidylate synthase (FAD)
VDNGEQTVVERLTSAGIDVGEHGQGFIRLDAVNASDLSVVNAARVSFGQASEQLTDKDKGLIGFLMREKHGTPFEHNFFRFHVKAPILVTREWFRHRIGWSYNEYSGRYSQITTEAYLPDRLDMRTQVGKPGAYTFEQMPIDAADSALSIMEGAYAQAFYAYEELLNMGVAKEVARNVVPVATMTEFYASTNARALMNFINLRGADTAQLEIRRYADVLEQMLSAHMPVTYKHFLANDKVAP